jgi:F0F1-type ATP synthase epsilon subunit
MADEKWLHLTILSREQVVFDDDVLSITSVNDTGEFDVLEMHAQFITLIKDRMLVRGKQGEKEYPLDHGIMKVNQDKVVVFLGMEELARADVEATEEAAFNEGQSSNDS